MQENRAASAIGLLEKKLVRAFQNDFLGLLQTFRYFNMLAIFETYKYRVDSNLVFKNQI
jgi:hypothetical protein